jgi:putative PIN family toxin of toxin-antitoxin system
MSEPVRVVYDCNVFLQFLLNRNGPSGRCLELAFEGRVQLYVSDAVLAELHDLPAKRVAIEMGIGAGQIRALIDALKFCSIHLHDVPSVFVHPVDPDDSHYIDLAIAADARIVVSRDRHLLNLVNPAKPWGDVFRPRFPHLCVLAPQNLLRDMESPGNE